MKKMMVVLVGLMVSGASMQAINVRPQRPAPTPAPVKTMPVVELPVRPVIVPEVEQPVVLMPVVEQPAQPEMPVTVVEPEVTMPEIPANATPEQKKGIVAQMKGKARAGYDTAKKWVGAHKKEVAAAVGVGAAVVGAAVATRQHERAQREKSRAHAREWVQAKGPIYNPMTYLGGTELVPATALPAQGKALSADARVRLFDERVALEAAQQRQVKILEALNAQEIEIRADIEEAQGDIEVEGEASELTDEMAKLNVQLQKVLDDIADTQAGIDRLDRILQKINEWLES